MIFITVIFIGIVVAALFYYLRFFVPIRGKEKGFEYVYVEIDGTVHELNKEEEAYLKEVFHPSDGARPYIKDRYKALTPDGKISGFISRRRVPAKIKIKDK